MATAEGLARRLRGHGIVAAPEEIVSPVEAAGRYLMAEYGQLRVLAVGIPELADALEAAGHTTVDDPLAAEAVVFGRKLDFSYPDLVALCRAVDRGVPFLVMNRDARLPVEGGSWLPGLGALVAAVVAATGRAPLVVGKPSPLLFQSALERAGLAPQESAMVGDTPESDIQGGLTAGMWTVQIGPTKSQWEPHLRVSGLDELLRLWQA